MALLVFTNSDATPQCIRVYCHPGSVQHIMAWYGAYYAGDNYSVELDGKPVPMDQNGAPLPERGLP